MKIDLDLYEWDNQVLKMDDKQKSEWVDKVNKIHNIAHNLLMDKKISKITFNRIEQIYLINPYRNILLSRHLKGTRFDGMFEYRMKFDLTKFNKALFKINQELKKENK